MTPVEDRLQRASHLLYCAARNEPKAAMLRRASLGLQAAALEFAAAHAALVAEQEANAPSEMAEMKRRLAERGLYP
jgi:hypothetical protein